MAAIQHAKGDIGSLRENIWLLKQPDLCNRHQEWAQLFLQAFLQGSSREHIAMVVENKSVVTTDSEETVA